MRWKRDPRPSFAADAANRRGFRHPDELVPERGDRAVREGSAPGRAQELARQSVQGGSASQQHRANRQLQSQEVRDRLPTIQELKAQWVCAVAAPRAWSSEARSRAIAFSERCAFGRDRATRSPSSRTAWAL